MPGNNWELPVDASVLFIIKKKPGKVTSCILIREIFSGNESPMVKNGLENWLCQGL